MSASSSRVRESGEIQAQTEGALHVNSSEAIRHVCEVTSQHIMER
jgi:hypothetical protein